MPLHLGRRMLVWQTSIYGPDGKRVALMTQTQLLLPAQDAASE
jgi:acyl-coenzyme A thioesterase PaaI-like protein